MAELPQVVFHTPVRNEALERRNPFDWPDLATDDVFGAKKVVFFALPGASVCAVGAIPSLRRTARS